MTGTLLSGTGTRSWLNMVAMTTPSFDSIVVFCGGLDSVRLHVVFRNLAASWRVASPSPPTYGSRTPAASTPATTSAATSLPMVGQGLGRADVPATGNQVTGRSRRARAVLGLGSGGCQEGADRAQPVQIVHIGR